jgi:hypothetical protein
MNDPCAQGPTTPPRWRVGIAMGLLGSLVAHGAFLAYVGAYLSTPDVGLSFELPEDVEFGLTEAVEVEAAPGAAEPEPPPEAASATGVGGDTSTEDETPDPDDGPSKDEADPKPPEDAAKTDQGSDDGFGTRALPPGAQLALRMDMTRIRASPLAPNIRRLLGNVPDWQAVLGGSGLEPVDDLARVLIASPNLHRSRVVIAGRHEGDPDLPRDIVTRMAAARGQVAEWTTDEGVPVAPWPDADTTERHIAIIGKSHFAISRPDDLPRLLAIAQARQARTGPDGDGTAGPDPEAWGEALLALGEDEALALEVEGARHFVRGPMTARFPTRLRIAAQELPNGRVRLSGEGTYDSPDAAQDALEYAERVREAYARNVLLQLSGLGRALRQAELEATAETLRFETELTLDQIRLMLGYIEGFLSRGQPPGRPSPGRQPPRDDPPADEDAPLPNPYEAP